MSRQTTRQRRSAPERCRDPHSRRLEIAPKRSAGHTRLRASVRAISVGAMLLVIGTPTLAAGETAQPSQPVAAASPAAPTTADDARSDVAVRCYAGACITTKLRAPAQLKTAVRKSPWLGFSNPPVVSMGDRKLGLRLLSGFYATVGLVPARPLLDPIPTDVSATDRVRVGVGCLVRF